MKNIKAVLILSILLVLSVAVLLDKLEGKNARFRYESRERIERKIEYGQRY